MNEKTVLKMSVYVFIGGCLLFLIGGLLFNDLSYLWGFVLGYTLNTLIYLLIIKMCEAILQFSMSTITIAVMFIIKLLLYALGFYIGVKVSFINILGVFVGYLSTKISIYIDGFIHKGGEENV